MPTWKPPVFYEGIIVLTKIELVENSRATGVVVFPEGTQATIIKADSERKNFEIQIEKVFEPPFLFNVSEKDIEKKYWRRTKEQFQNAIKNSVGYNESDNKAEFIKGVQVAYSWLCEEENERIISEAWSTHILKQQEAALRKDLETVSEIIRRHMKEI